LLFTIYADPDQNLLEAKQSASHGYAGVVALTRGKGLSPDPIEPYEHESGDVNAVIDWISRQPWCNGKVGMYGGSYSGFAQWAATKKMNPALKTIVPYVAAIPGFGLPMENNVFLNANYGWTFFVTDNKYLDYKTYNDQQRWNSLQQRWYASGTAYRKLDSLDGAHNIWLQRWLQHPAYDKYWQSMVPYKEGYANINIPVLTITGYYDDGQISALQYLREHYKYNRNANHYLIIGPYDHFGAQMGGIPVLREYKVDPVALINTREITYQWLDYILKDGVKPELLKNKINYEVMGADTWRHAASLEKMPDKMLTLYLDNSKTGNYYNLSGKKPAAPGFISQRVDLADRNSTNNSEYYPYPIIIKELTDTSGLYFLSEPFDNPVSVEGMFSGELRLSINKKDIDFGVVLYEVMPDGQFFHLSYYLGRAGYAKDMSQRVLLTPGQIETIPFDRSRMVCRQLSKGSRLLIVVNINKNPDAQINYGTGKDVSDESIKDATAPLEIKWYNDSFIRIPVGK
jgi:putative CocE/NonD family hydrolase